MPLTIVADPDGADAARRAIALAATAGERTAVWVGEESDPGLAEFRDELERRGPR